MFLNISLSLMAEIAALVCAAILLYNQPRPWLSFIPFLALIVLVEFGGRFIEYELKRDSNQWLYNLLILVYFPFYFWVYSLLPLLAPYKRVINWCGIIYIIFSIFNLLLLQGFHHFDNFTYILGSFMLIILSLIYYILTIINPGNQSLFKQPFFWLVSAVFIFQVGSMYIHFFQDSLESYFRQTGTNLSRIILQFLNVWLYGLHIIAFFIKKIYN